MSIKEEISAQALQVQQNLLNAVTKLNHIASQGTLSMRDAFAADIEDHLLLAGAQFARLRALKEEASHG